MRIFICSEGISSRMTQNDIGNAGHEIASSTSSIDIVIVEPKDFIEDNGSEYVWEISSTQKDILESVSSNIPIIVHDNEDDGGYCVVDKAKVGFLGYDTRQGVNFIKSEMDTDDLGWVIPSKKSEYERVTKGIDSAPNHLSSFENEFINRVMSTDPTSGGIRSTTKIPDPDSNTSFTQQHQNRGSFVGNDEVL